jgi:GT2 family glycosyltransferase
MPDLLVITVNYKGADATATFLESAARLDEFQRAHLIVVENGSQDGSAENLQPLVAGSTNIELLESPQNLGYFGGANWALQRYLAGNPLPDWVIICNNDIVFDDRQFLSKLIRKNPDDVAVIAPAIIARLTGADCNPFMRHRPGKFQLLRIRIWHSSYYFMWVKQLFSPYVRTIRHFMNSHFVRATPEEPQKIYGAHGSFLIFNRSYFNAGGYIDDGHFLYAEELCVAEICFRLNLRVIHDPALRVWHQGHQATGRWLDRQMYEYARHGLHYALQKHFRVEGPRTTPADLRRSCASGTSEARTPRSSITLD